MRSSTDLVVQPSAPRIDGRRTRNAELTIQRLLAAARDVFAAEGYEGATVDKIVGVAGVTKGAFYNHFRAKEDIFLQILEQRGEGNRQRFLESCQLPRDPA